MMLIMAANNFGLRFLLSLIIIHLLILAPQTISMPPPPPIQCNSQNCLLRNAYGVWGDRKPCSVARVVYPTSEEELRLAVADANRRNHKVKVASSFSHTIPKLACPTTDENPGNALLISSAKYNSEIDVDVANMVVTADAGVGLRQLIDKVEEANLSLVAAPYWEGVSVGGVISTGSHGSSWWGRGSAVHDHVVGLSLVVPANESEGYAKVVVFEAGDPLLDAARLSLGLLGVISKVKLKLDRGFKRSITFNYTDDGHFEDEFMELAKKYEFADITWYPSRRTAVYRYDDRVALDAAAGDGVYDFLGFQSQSIVVSQSVRALEKALEKARNVEGKCTMASTELAYKKLIANGLKNNNLLFTGYPVIGRQGKMQTSGSCLYSSSSRFDLTCGWDPRIKGLFFYETTAIFPAAKFKSFILDVKRLRDLNPDNFCGVDVYNGFLIRFLKGSQAYLGQSEDSVVVDFNYYRSDEATTPRLNEDVWEEVEQMAFFKYGAKPHWAKNRNLAFLNVQNKYPNFKKFVAAKSRLDPKGMFSSDSSDEILFGKGAVMSDGCALEGQCICSEDRHCSPSEGYLCKQGLVYTEARVCRRYSSSFSIEL